MYIWFRQNFNTLARLYTGMITVSHSQSGKYVGWLQNGEKQFLNHLLNIVLHRRDTKESTCLLWDIMTEKSGLCCYAVRITQNTYVKK